jgi:ABC-type phosphate transport system substrate-binding protein
MMSHRMTRRIFQVALLVAAFGVGRPGYAGRQVFVVVHRDSPAANLSADAVRGYFLKHHKEWASGQKVRPVQQEGSSHGAFLRKVLRMSSAEYERYWLERKYSAAETPPKSVEDDEAVVKFVGAMNGAIGYVESTALSEAARSKVKVIHVISL